VISARSADKLKETQRLCLQHSPHVEVVVGDISDEGVCKEMVDAAVEKFGGIDVLLLNAAFSPEPRWFADMAEPVSVWVGHGVWLAFHVEGG
jgi:NAD(P)-dependent dehydrogenase (short-subunit alcohol dehydrogenase family)